MSTLGALTPVQTFDGHEKSSPAEQRSSFLVRLVGLSSLLTAVSPVAAPTTASDDGGQRAGEGGGRGGREEGVSGKRRGGDGRKREKR